MLNLLRRKPPHRTKRCQHRKGKKHIPNGKKECRSIHHRLLDLILIMRLLRKKWRLSGNMS